MNGRRTCGTFCRIGRVHTMPWVSLRATVRRKARKQRPLCPLIFRSPLAWCFDSYSNHVPSVFCLVKFFASVHASANLCCLAHVARHLHAHAPTVTPLAISATYREVVGCYLKEVPVNEATVTACHE